MQACGTFSNQQYWQPNLKVCCQGLPLPPSLPQALLERMRSQLAWLQESMPQQQPGSHPLLQSIDDNAFAAALHKPPSAAAGAPARATTGIAMAVASAPGAGRQLLAATGRVVAAAAVATAVREQVQLAQAAAAGAPAGTAGCVRQRTFDPLPRHEPQALQEQQREKPRWTAVNLLLAPLTPLLHGLAAPRNRNSRNAAGEAAPSRNGYDLLLELLSSLAAGVQVGLLSAGGEGRGQQAEPRTHKLQPHALYWCAWPS